MFDKFNFYDLLGYLLPGAVVVLVLYWFGRGILALPVPALPTDLGGSFLFIGLSYIVGQVLVQGIAGLFEEHLNRKEGGRPSERLLSADDMTFTPDLKARIEQYAKDAFQLVPASEPGMRHEGISRSELFDLCYALVVQKGLAAHTEIFLAISGLSRGLYVAAWLGLLVSCVTLVLELGVVVYHDSGGAVPSSGPLARNLGGLAVAAIGVVVFGLAIWLTRYRFNRFRQYFATSVYYNVLASCAGTEAGPSASVPATPTVGVAAGSPDRAATNKTARPPTRRT